MRKHTVLHTIETAGPGGAESILLSLASSLNSSRYRSIVMLPGERWLGKKLRERGIPMFVARSSRRYDPQVVRAMARVVRQEKVDLIHSHLPDQNFYSCLVGLLTRRKTIATYHGAILEPQLGQWRSAAKLWLVRHSATAVVAVSEYLEQSLKSCGFPARKIVRISNGVDMGRFNVLANGRLRKDLGVPPGVKLVGMVANLRESKGYEHFVRAARKVIDAMPETRFVAVGEPKAGIAERLGRLVQELSLQDRVHFLGYRDDVPAVLANLDVFVLSSVSEGFSLATVEAMAAARPVVVTRSGGPQEIVEDGRTGFLVPLADPAALAARICELLADPQKASALGQNARALVESRFSMSQMIRQYEDLYERCLGSG